MLKYMYITNDVDVAEICQKCGVDRIFVDMEYIGKDIRQGGLDTVKNHHTVDDVKKLRRVLNKSELLVRINPIHDNSENEINEVISAGADIVMLPMWKSVSDVKIFLNLINRRVKTVLLLETKEAAACIDDVLQLQNIDEVYIGLNDLHLSMNKKFMFELYTDGTVDSIANKLKSNKIPFGIGGVGRVGENNMLPAENIMCEHYRIGSSCVILSRSFCFKDSFDSILDFETAFSKGVSDNRIFENFLSNQSENFFSIKHMETNRIIDNIVGEMYV